MEKNLINLIKACKIFSMLNDVEIKSILNEFDRVSLDKDKFLFKKGEMSNSLYILIKGKLAIFIENENNETKFITEIEPGDAVGELAALSHEPRSFTVKSIEHSTLLKLSSEAFIKICSHYPSASIEMINSILSRTRSLVKIISSVSDIKKHVVFIPANHKTDCKIFFEEIKKYTGKDILLLSDFDEFNSEIHDLIDNSQKQHKSVLYLLSSFDTKLAKIALDKMDSMYVLGNTDPKPEIHHHITKHIKNKMHQFTPELILFHPNKKKLKHTIKWLKLLNFQMHQHIRINEENDWHRLFRFIRGKAVGLVLGGGGLRCWLHLGVVKALSEANIPIDVIGGTSSGAIAAGYYAMHGIYQKSDKVLDELADIVRQTISFRNLTWPAISLFSGKDYTEKLQNIFGKNRIENLTTPCFFIASNLTKGKQKIIRNGYIWKGIRSSTAIPAIYPPVVVRGKLFLDGGIMNNLPVDIMRKILGQNGTVIAAKLSSSKEDMKKYNFPTILTPWNTFLSKFHIAHKEYIFPTFMDTFLKALQAGSARIEAENSLLTDILIAPDLSQYGIFNVNEKQQDELIKLGYKTTLKALHKWNKSKDKVK